MVHVKQLQRCYKFWFNVPNGITAVCSFEGCSKTYMHIFVFTSDKDITANYAHTLLKLFLFFVQHTSVKD